MSFNEKQYNNTGAMIKHSEEIVKSYVTMKRGKSGLTDQFTRGQKKEEAKALLEELKIYYGYVRRNITDFVWICSKYQGISLSSANFNINELVKTFMKNDLMDGFQCSQDMIYKGKKN